MKDLPSPRQARLDRLVYRHLVYTPTVWLRGEPLSRCLRELNASQWCSAADLDAIQEAKVDRLVRVAASEVPYYRERIDLAQHPKRLTMADLRRLPMLTKEELRGHQAELRNSRVRRTSVKTTGGSTGQAVTVTKSRLATAYELAAMWRGWGWAGVDIGDRQARFWGVPQTTMMRWRSRLVDFVSHRRRFSAFGMTPETMDYIRRDLDRFQPDFVYGYVSVLTEFAQFLTQAGNRRFAPKAVIATSEVLTFAHRAALERGFGCPVYEEYGCGELGNIAHQCERGRLHLSSENLIVEVVNDGAPAAARETGELVVTELNNDSMPLIRYRLGDFGNLTGAPCECGRTLPVLGSVAGRAYDLVYNREGRLFHGEYFMYIFEDAKKLGLGVDAFQVIQKDPEHFVIRVKAGAGYSDETERFITERIHRDYGGYADVAFERVDAIARESSGKLRLVVGAASSARSFIPRERQTS